MDDFPTDEEYDLIVERASRLLRINTSGYRGQMVSKYNDINFWIIKVTKEYLESEDGTR